MEDLGSKVIANASDASEIKRREDAVNFGRENYELTERMHRENTWLAHDAVFVIKPGETEEERKIAEQMCVDKAIKEEETRLEEEAEHYKTEVKHDKESCRLCKQEAVKADKEERQRRMYEIWCMETEEDLLPGMCVGNGREY
jgi:hypothetical protein